MLALPYLLILLVIPWSLTWTLIAIHLHLSLVLSVIKERSNRLLTCYIVGDNIHQLVNGLWVVAP